MKVKKRGRVGSAYWRQLTLACLILGSNFILPTCAESVKGVDVAEYIGAQACVDCHQREAELWKGSDHFAAMAEMSPENVLAEFDGLSREFHGSKYRFYREGEHYWVETNDTAKGVQHFLVRYAFGFYPLQQYLVERKGVSKTQQAIESDGHLQAMNVVWDSRTRAEGGQRWYHLQDEAELASVEHPFHWQGHFQNWNSRCAHCHSTNLRKNYDAKTQRFDTQWTDINVACEACHGPGSEHVGLAKRGEFKRSENLGLLTDAIERSVWEFKPGERIASIASSGSKSLAPNLDTHVDRCGACHSRRFPVADQNIIGEFHDKYFLQLLDRDLYFADGQIQDEVYVLGSFLQSKMHHAGVNCLDCHEPHSGKLLAEDSNTVCAQCHLPTYYDKTEHHFHPLNSSVSEVKCVDCHMPERVYMGVDARRDHRFSIPNPLHGEQFETPNACLKCHKDKDLTWVTKELKARDTLPALDPKVALTHRAFQGDIAVAPELAALVADTSLPAIWRASWMQQLASLGESERTETAKQALKSTNPLLRRSAVAALRNEAPALRWQILKPYLNDSVRSVRFELASVLLDALPQLSEKEREPINALLEEYRQSLTFSADFPSSQLGLAQLALMDGNIELAAKFYEQALAIASKDISVLMRYAEFERARGHIDKEYALLMRAIKAVPDSASVHHALGLYYVRQKNYALALEYLALAAGDLFDTQAHYVYVYAVALDSQGQTQKAIVVLQKAAKRWPNNVNLLMLEVMYLEKMGLFKALQKPLESLSLLVPNLPQVEYWQKKYRP